MDRGSGEEVWKPVVGFENIYEVSNLGRVKSCARSIMRSNGWPQSFKERIRAIATNVNGYKAVTLNVQGDYERRLVSHMVAEAFLGPRPPRHEVSHEDGDLSNNAELNLKYRTKRDNIALQLKHGTRLRGEACHQAKLKSKDIPIIRKQLADGKSRQEIAEAYRVTNGVIRQIEIGRSWTHA